MIILGIETSCDDTSAAVIEGEKNQPFAKVLANVSATSLALHAKTGGIIPEIAAREQIKFIIPVIKHALQQSAKEPKDIDAIAVTYGPGLIGSLLVGVETAKTLGFAWNKPLIPVNHLFGHVYANWLESSLRETISDEAISSRLPLNDGIQFPVIALIVSGGHTDLILMKSHEETVLLGGTRDDAAGEAIDKIGREIHFPYPSGPAFEKAALLGDPKAYKFPRPVMYDKHYDFSFSGLKAAGLREIKKQELHQPVINNLARGIQDAIIDVLVYKTLLAAEEFGATAILLSGGVSANQALRDAFVKKIDDKRLSIPLHAPEKQYCTDNGAMIAAAGLYMGKQVNWDTINANPELYFD